MECWWMKCQFFILIFIAVKERSATAKSSVIKSPKLQLKTLITPKKGVIAGDTVLYSFEVSHSKKSFAKAWDVQLHVIFPAFLVVGSHRVQNDSVKPDNVTRSSNEVMFKFANISMNSHVIVAMDILVDPYYMRGTRDKVVASSMVNVLYYDELGSCDRPANKWNVRSISVNILLTFMADKVCERPLEPLYESQFLASSFEKSNFQSLGNSPHHASFEYDKVWSPAQNMNEDIHQYLHIQFDRIMKITKVATRGNGETYPASFVKTYVVYYSKNGIQWSMANAGFNSKVFLGNVDSTTVKVSNMKIPIEAKLLRIVPKTWKRKIALKVKLFGCSAYQVPVGSRPLGISSDHVRLNLNHPPGGWCTTRQSKQTLVVDLGTSHVITEVAVQSRFQTTGNLINAFYLAYKNEEGTKIDIKENNVRKTFLGNPLEDITMRHRLINTFTTQIVYIEPKQLSSIGCLRIELYGYKEDDIPNADYCNIFDFEDADLVSWTMTGSAFNNQPTFHDNLHARTGHAANHEGAWWIGTKEDRNRSSVLPGNSQGNQPIGTLTSPKFLVSFSKLFFLFAGTPDPEKARVELLVNGVVVRVASAKTGNESMTQITWDMRGLLGRGAKIRVVDSSSDGFVSFDGLKGNCNLSEDRPPVFEKSFLLSPSNNTLYTCQLSHTSDAEGISCRFTSDNGVSWKDISTGLSFLLGISKLSGKLHGVSRDRKDYLESTDYTGRSWKQVNSSFWKTVKNDVITVVEIPHIPITGLAETDEPSSILTLRSDSGHEYSASSLGVYHRAPGGSWEMIATWFGKEYPSVCTSQPCNNGGICHKLDENDYHCACPKGFTGKICDSNIDDCKNDSCENGGKCIDDLNKFFCLCDSFFTGPRCEKNIDDCETSPCLQGALCIDGLGDFMCQCPSGFVGGFCELEIDECASVPCQHGGLCIDEVSSYTCHCRKGYSGTNCEYVHSSAFEVLSTRTIQYGAHRYLVVNARLPLDDRSRHQTWCHDYQMLCHSLNKTRPTGCGRSFNHIVQNHECLTKYDSVMDHSDTLGCPPNIRVSSIANMAGYTLSTSSNSFAFSQCADTSCTDVLPQSGCHGALSCINQDVANTEVYTLCSYSDSNFVVEDKRFTSFEGVDYLALYVRPITSTARHDNWCRDYQRLCQSYGKRPTSCSKTLNNKCQNEYHSIITANNGSNCDNSIFQNAGLPSTSDNFAFHNCSELGCQKKLPTCDGVMCLNDSNTTYRTLCTQPQTAFIVLDERRTIFNNVSVLVVKARLPRDRKSIQEDWCQDYSTLCESYGLRPTGFSGITRDYGYTRCRDKYGSVGDIFGYLPWVKVAELAKKVGFSSATELNSFALNNCMECPSVLSTTGCDDRGLGCIKPNKNSDVYTACVDPQTVFNVLETKSTSYKNTAYLVIKVRLPRNRTLTNLNVQHEQICLQYGRRPIKCNKTSLKSACSSAIPSDSSSIPSRSSAMRSRSSIAPSNSSSILSNSSSIPSNFSAILPSSSVVLSSCSTGLSYQSDSSSDHQGLCNDRQGNTLKTIVQKAGFPDASNTNSMISFENITDNDSVIYTFCQGPDSNFDVISAKPAEYHGQEYLVLKINLPSHGVSRYKDWCEDYMRLCLSYGQRPTGCGGEKHASLSSCTACLDGYDSHMPDDNNLSCPLNNMITSLANQVGFSHVSLNNTFAFSFCNATCSKNISKKINFISSVNFHLPLYTVCSRPNTSFSVQSTKAISYLRSSYKVIKATILSHNTTTHKNWCQDYHEVCKSYGMRPVVTSKDSDLSCQRDYNGLPLKRNELYGPEMLKHLVKKAGYLNSSLQNIFAFNKSCQNNCFSKSFKSVNEPAMHVDSGVVAIQDHLVYAVCVSSDSGFKVVHSRRFVHEDRSYLVLKTRIPLDGVSKFDNWCLDYQRLCTGYEMLPVTIKETESSSNTQTSCVQDFFSAVISRNFSLHFLVGAHVASIAKLAGYRGASRDNSFAFRQCDPKHCRRVLTSECLSGLDCLSNRYREVYTLCTDSDSNFHIEQTRHIKHKAVPYLLIQSSIPEHGLSKHDTWCEDYQHLCNSFGMQPTGCGNSWKNLGNLRCVLDYASFASPVDNIGCGDEAVEILQEMTKKASLKNGSVFVFNDCKSCSKRTKLVCDDALYCLQQTTSVVTICAAFESNYKILELKQYKYSGQVLTIAKTSLNSNGSSFGENWCHDYSKMCSSLGKRPFTCSFPGNVGQYKNREKYNAFLFNSGICPSNEVLRSVALQAGFNLANKENILGFINYTSCTKKLNRHFVCSKVVDIIGQLVHPDAKNCCKCNNNTTLYPNNTLVTSLLTNTTFSRSWKGCVSLRLHQVRNKNQNCTVARDCLNDTRLANHPCELLSKCFHGNCLDCCACNYSSRNVCYTQILMKECPPGSNCSQFIPKLNTEVYTFCADYSDSNFDVQETRDVNYAGLDYIVIRAQVPSHGYSKSSNWCKDYKMLCNSVGKRPLACGAAADVLKRSRECRVTYDALMVDGMSCPPSLDLANIAIRAGFPASVNQSVGLWSCEQCGRNFSDVWNTTNTTADIYAVCSSSHSNFDVIEKRRVNFRGAAVTVIMASVPHHGLSMCEDWCLDYSQLCKSYNLRPVGCAKSKDNIDEHAQCSYRYDALMFSDGSIDCSENSSAYAIAQIAGFKHATPNNSFIFNSCLFHHCTKSLPSAFGHDIHFNSTERVFYTVCASSDSAYDVVAKKLLTIDQQDYLVIRAKIPEEGKSKYENWCRDYQRLCEGYGMRSFSCKKSHQDLRNLRECEYNYELFNMVTSSKPCPSTSSIVQQAGFDNVSSINSFKFDSCDEASCPAKMPYIFCWNTTHHYSVFNTITKQANITRVDYVRSRSANTSGINGTSHVVNRTEKGYCLILPEFNPPFKVQGIELRVALKHFACEEKFNVGSPGVNISFVNITVNQTLETVLSYVTKSCKYSEVNTVCLRPSVTTNFAVDSTRKITSSGREYLIIKARLLSLISKSQSWCTDYNNLCQSFGTSPLACPKSYGFNTDYLKCVESYEAVMMSDVGYDCPSNDFILELVQAAGYDNVGTTNSFALLNCQKCQSRLPLSGCSESLHCLSEETFHKYVYTACVVTNSDSNFHVIQKRTKKYNGTTFTVIRSRIPSDGKSLHDTWCLDYQRLCESLNLRPVACNNAVTPEEANECKGKYNVVFHCPIKVHEMADEAGFRGATNTNSFSFSKCNSCSKTLTSSCDKGLKCLKTGSILNEVYTMCTDINTKTNFAPLATKEIHLGNVRFRIIQAKLRSKLSVNSDWGKDYENLCKYYDEKPTGCGYPGGENDPGVFSCREKYSSHVLPGGELQCDPNAVISKLARDVGFVNATPLNSFGFSSCNTSSLSTLSSSCSSYLPCLKWLDSDPVVYTVCLKNNVVSNFKVLSTKTMKYRQSNYLVLYTRLPSDGKSLHANWCHDYQKLCNSYNMLPTGCGGSGIHQSNYSTCSTTYGSHMPASNSLGCGDSKMASRIAKKAGYQNSFPTNTFVFHNCEKCNSTLTSSSQCDDALWCIINNDVWNNGVYTLCVDPTTNFNVAKTASVKYNGTDYFVIQARLPADGRAKSESWCREYEMLCESYKKKPVSCYNTADNWKCASDYQSIVTSSMSCDAASSQASSIAVNAGFYQATKSNSFIFSVCDKRSCSKELPASECTQSFSCIQPNLVDHVYAICAEDKSLFRVLDSKKISVSGAVYTIVSAVLPEGMYSTWCQHYSRLCHSVAQSPAVLYSDVIDEDILKCRDKFDGVLLPKETEEYTKGGVHRLAVNAGYNALYGNTFAFKSCSQDVCSFLPNALNCSHSLYCLNGEPKERIVYGVCVDNTPISNYYVLDTRPVGSNNTKYLALKVRLPLHRQSKHESWCKDYELLCQSYNMRPLSSLPSPACQFEYHSIFQSGHLSYLGFIHKAGFPNASSDNFYILQQCATKECGRNFLQPKCITGSCISSANENREIYTLCSSLEESFATNFEVQDVRNVWLNADFLVAQVRLPSHGTSKSENWCKEYETFCENYSRRPYTSAGLLKQETFDHGACYWRYNATSYRMPILSSVIVQRAGFNPGESCVSSLYQCSKCGKHLHIPDSCPFENCQFAVKTCLDYYIICT